MGSVLTRGGGQPRSRPVSPLTVGHFYLSAQDRLYCLNETARQFVREGVPILEGLACAPLLHLDGSPVRTEDLPFRRAWKERVVSESTFLLAVEHSPCSLTWSAAPLFGPDGSMVGVSAT